VRIGIVAALPPQLIPRLLAATAAGAPEISVVVAAIPGARSPAEALEHDLDLAVVRGAVDEPGLGSALLASEPVGIALPADHPLAAADVVSPRDLNGQPMVTFAQSADPQEYDRLYGAMAAAGLRDLRVEHESHPGSVDASLRLVASGAALSLKLESEVVAFASDLVTWRPLQGVDLRVVISAAWRPDRTSPALTRLLPIVLSAASEVVAPPAVTTDEPATRSGR
jgi:DNA-binding transcriptional LysR family regulator